MLCYTWILYFSFKTSTKILPQIHTKGGLWQAFQNSGNLGCPVSLGNPIPFHVRLKTESIPSPQENDALYRALRLAETFGIASRSSISLKMHSITGSSPQKMFSPRRKYLPHLIRQAHLMNFEDFNPPPQILDPSFHRMKL